LVLVAASVVACRSPNYIVVGVSEADTDVIVRVAWLDGSRDVLLRANDVVGALILDWAPRDPEAIILDAATCRILGRTALVPKTNWISVANELGPDQVYDGPIIVIDQAKGIARYEFPLAPEDGRCLAAIT
jgi:hypothetical protein